MSNEVEIIREPVSFPRLSSQVNVKLAREFVESRYLGLFWCEDLCVLPQETVEESGVWVRYSRNARQAVGLDFKTVSLLADIVGRSTLTLHNLCGWYERSPVKCQRSIEQSLPGSSLLQVLMLLNLLTVDPKLRHDLREEFKEREVMKKSLKYGRRVEDEERESRGKVDVFDKTGSGQMTRPPRSVDQGDDQLLSAAATALHETWRMEVPKKPVWKQIGEVEYQHWFDPRFHEQLVRSPIGQRLVNVNAPHLLLPPSLREEGLEVAKSCLDAIRQYAAGAEHYHIDVIAKAVHERWLERRRIEYEQRVAAEECDSATVSSEGFMDLTYLSMPSFRQPPQHKDPFSKNSSSKQQLIDVPKWCPVRGNILSEEALNDLRTFVNEDDRCVVLICMDAFQLVADRSSLVPQLAVQPVALSIHRQFDMPVSTLSEIRKRVAKLAQIEEKKVEKENNTMSAAQIVSSLGLLTASTVISPSKRIKYASSLSDQEQQVVGESSDNNNGVTSEEEDFEKIINTEPATKDDSAADATTTGTTTDSRKKSLFTDPIIHVNLSHVNLVSTNMPAQSTTDFLQRMSSHQTDMFNEMRPLAKRVLASMDQEMKAHIAKGKSELRYRIDEASLLHNAPNLIRSTKLTSFTSSSSSPSNSFQRPNGSLSPGGVNVQSHRFSKKATELAAILNPSNPNFVSCLQILQQTKDTLRELLLVSCGIGAGAMSRLRRDGLVRCSALTAIDLSENPLGSEGAAILARSLSSLPLLKSLGMRGTGCSGEGAHLLFRALKYHRVITVDVSNNSLGMPEQEGVHGPVMRALKALLRSNTSLTHLDLSWNGFRREMSLKIGEWLRGNKTLYGLHLSGNKGCCVDSRGFIRKRNNVSLSKVTPAFVCDYPNNPIQPAIERCWVCGRWSEKQIVFELDVSSLPAAPKKSSDSVSSLVGGSKSKRGTGGSVASRSTMGSKLLRHESQSSMLSASSSVEGGGVDKGVGDYETMVVTCHMSIDDPPFSASVMEEQDPDEEIVQETEGGLFYTVEKDPAKKYYSLPRMLPPGDVQYYFMVFGDGKPLAKYNGPKYDPDSEHGVYFMPPLREEDIPPSFSHLVRPEAYAKDLEESLKMNSLLPKCGFTKVALFEEFVEIVEEERVNDFQCVNLDEEEEEEEEVEEVIEEYDWHPRDCIFVIRKEATGGSFYDSMFDHGPQEREMTAAEIADSIDGKASNGAAAAGGGGGSNGINGGSAVLSKSNSKEGGGMGGINDEEEEENHTKPPLTLAFEKDVKHLRSIMESGTKKARAFFPNEITDLYLPAEGKDPKPSHRSHHDKKKAMMLSLLTAAVTAEAEARTARMEKLGFESVGPTASFDSGSEDSEMDPVTELFTMLQARFPVLQGGYRYYSSLNSRNPFSMSVHSWLALCKDTGIDKLVSFEQNSGKKKDKTKKKNKKRSNSSSPKRINSSLSINEDGSATTPPNGLMFGGSDGMGSFSGGMGLAGFTSVSGGSGVFGNESKDMGGIEEEEEHVDNSSKMALEVIFFTATSSGTGKSSSGGGKGGEEHAASAIDLNYSKHDMRRHEFILALMALARYRQRRMIREKPNDRKDKFLNSLFASSSSNEPQVNREQWTPMSFNEFLDILDIDLIGRIEKGNVCNSDLFRENMFYRESVANLFTAFESTIKFNYNSYKLSPMGCGRKFTQLPLSAFIRMMKDCGVLGELVSSQEISACFMDSRMVRECEVVAGDRCLSLIDLMEALLRLAFRIMNIWPKPPIKSSKKEEGTVIPSHLFQRRGSVNSIHSDEIPTSTLDDSLEDMGGLDQEEGEEAIEKGSIGSGEEEQGEQVPSKTNVQKDEDLDPLLRSAHKTLRGITELLLMALRDRDIPGLRYLFQERKKKEAEAVARLHRQHAAATAAAIAADNTSSHTSGNSEPPSHIPVVLEHQTVSELETTKQALAILEQVTTQALHMQRSSNRGILSPTDDQEN